VLETILVRGGRPQLLDRHLARLAESMAALYATAPQAGLRRELIEAAGRDGSAALRVRAHPDGRTEVSRGPLPCRPTPVLLRPYTLPGGLGRHKWADRRLLAALAVGGSTPLLVDSDGSVLEAAWGNVWIAEGESLLTPPADGRLLPGVRRDSILRGAQKSRLRGAEACISLERLAEADRVFVSSALAGLVGAVLDGLPSPAEDRATGA
jgi:para-aminobenzoate synthetase/4-amino-4-deoxychorismate lyase